VQLDILVENSGRVNFTKALREERKGITREVLFNGKQLLGWQVYTLPMPDAPRPRFGKAKVEGPAFYRGTFKLTRTGDTFLDTRGWGKGTVWVNGHHLGRFWSIGPQQTLYVPGVWLKRGTNEVVVFALTEPTQRTMTGLAAPILNQPERTGSRE
jgi:beta-galactosidase